MLWSQESRRHNKAGEERGGEVDEGTEGRRWGGCLADCAAIVLNGGGGTQGSASRTAVLLGFRSNNHKAQISTWSLPNPPSLHLPPLLLRTLQGFICALAVPFTQQNACAFKHIYTLALLLWEKQDKHTTTQAPWLSPIRCFHSKWKRGNEHMIKDQWSAYNMLFWWTDSI